MNSLNLDMLEPTVVVLRADAFRTARPLQQRLFRAEDGFGMVSVTSGRAIFGEMLATGAKGRIEGDMLERLATDAEIREAAVERVDRLRGYTLEFAPSPDAHRAEYDAEVEALTSRAVRENPPEG